MMVAKGFKTPYARAAAHFPFFTSSITTLLEE